MRGRRERRERRGPLQSYGSLSLAKGNRNKRKPLKNRVWQHGRLAEIFAIFSQNRLIQFGVGVVLLELRRKFFVQLNAAVPILDLDLLMRFRTPKAMIALTAVALLSVTLPAAFAADHLDAPALRVQGQGDRDLADLFAFQSPTNPDNTVLIMTVNPLAGLANPFGTTSSTSFGTDVSYEFQIDNTGDSIPDVTYAATFGAEAGGSQAFSITRDGNAYTAGTTGSTATTVGGASATAGLFDDPFFFDLFGFLDSFNFTGQDTFAGTNVSGIVLEVPSSELNGADTNIGIQATTVVGGVQIDRVGRPAITTALIGDSARKDDFNAGNPADDFAEFGAEVNAAIAGLSDQANADALTPILLPDLLTFDTSDASGFLNGRRLDDDVIDAELGLLTAGGLTSDGASLDANGADQNGVAFLGVFPYLGPANVAVPEPASLGLLLMASILGLLRRSRR